MLFRLQDGDMVKIDLGAHIDGFIAVVAHTVVVGSSKDNKVKGRAADAIMAAHLASEAALRLVKPGNEVRQSSSFVFYNTRQCYVCCYELVKMYS